MDTNGNAHTCVKANVCVCVEGGGGVGGGEGGCVCVCVCACACACVYGFLLFFGTESAVLRKPFM